MNNVTVTNNRMINGDPGSAGGVRTNGGTVNTRNSIIAGNTASGGGRPDLAGVSVSGRVITESGRGITNVVVTMTDMQGNVRTATSTTFGYYRFENVAAGETYIFAASGKRFFFTQGTQVHSIMDDTNDVNLVALSVNGRCFR